MTHSRPPSLLVLLALGCAADPSLPPTHGECLPAVTEASWDNSLRTLPITTLGAPVHAGIDAVAEPGEMALLEAKFSYGTTSADLEGERVAVFVEVAECDWRDLGEHITDSDGRIHVDFDTQGLAVGSYRVSFTVVGDLSTARSVVHVMPADVPIVIFDIDGTLTTSDVELVDGIILHHVGTASDELYDLAGSPLTRAQWVDALDTVLDEDADAYEGAAAMVRHYVDQGVQPVYITGRPYLYDDLTRHWLEARDMPAGPLVMVQEILEALPAGVAGYKARTLDLFQVRGSAIVAAYGNAKTDICAYETAGIPSDVTFIIGPNAGLGCEGGGNTPTVAIRSYPEHLASIE